MKKLILLIAILSTLMPAMAQDYIQSWPYTCNHVAIDSNGNIWIDHGFVSSFDGTSWKAIKGNKFANVHQIAVSPENDVWFAGQGTLHKLNDTDTLFFNFQNSIVPVSQNLMVAFRDDTVWCFSDSGVYVYESNSWSVYDTTDKTLEDKWLMDIDVDSEGNFWIASSRLGLIKYDGQNYTVYDESNSSIPDENLSEVLCDKNDNIWIGTEFNGVGKYDGQNWDTITVDNSNLPDYWIGSITEQEDTLWLTTPQNGIIKYYNNNMIVYDTTNFNFPPIGSYEIAIDEYGNKWLANMDGIFVFNEYGVILGVGGGEQQSRISTLYPNPNDGSFTISFFLKNTQLVNIELFDNSGKKVKDIFNGYSTENDNGISFNTEDLPSGIYYYRLSYSSYFETGKIIINK